MKKGATVLVLSLGLLIPTFAVNANTALVSSEAAMFGEGLVIIYQGLTDTTVDVFDTSEATLILEDENGNVVHNSRTPAPNSTTFVHDNYPEGTYKLTVLNKDSDVIKYEPVLFRNQ